MNWKAEATEKLRRYNAMRLAVINLPEQIQQLEEDACSIRPARTDSTPVRGGGNKREEAMINNLVHREELNRSLKRAKSWLRITDRALTALPQDEKEILHRLYIYPERGAIDRLCTDLGLEQSSVYRKRDQALLNFAIAYYGLVDAF